MWQWRQWLPMNLLKAVLGWAGLAALCWGLGWPHAWNFLGFYQVVPEHLFSGGLSTDNEFWGWSYIALISFGWRELSVGWHISAAKVQVFLNKRFGSKKRFLQWYSVVCYAVVWEVPVALSEIYDIITSKAISDIRQEWSNAPLSSFEFQFNTSVPRWLLIMVLLSPCFCVATFLVVWFHVGRLSRLSDHYLRRPEDDRDIGRSISRAWALDMVIVCVMLPGWFSLMSLYSMSRIFQGMSTSISSQKRLQYLVTFQVDRELAVLIEVFTLLAFACLVMKPIVQWADHSGHGRINVLCWTKPDKFWLTMSGVYYSVLAGVLQSLLNIMASLCLLLISKDHFDSFEKENFCEQHSKDSWKHWLYCFISQYRGNINQLGTVGVILCAYNMYFACSIEEVVKYLPRANLKFQGTRAIILVAQIQSKFLVLESPLPSAYDQTVTYSLNGWCSALLHMALIQIEVCFIAVLHVIIWRGHVIRRQKELETNENTPMAQSGPDDKLIRHQETYDALIFPSHSSVLGAGSPEAYLSECSEPDPCQDTVNALESLSSQEGFVSRACTTLNLESPPQSARCSLPSFEDDDHKHLLLPRRRKKKKGKGHRLRRRPAHNNYPWLLSLCLLAVMLVFLLRS